MVERAEDRGTGEVSSAPGVAEAERRGRGMAERGGGGGVSKEEERGRRAERGGGRGVERGIRGLSTPAQIVSS